MWKGNARPRVQETGPYPRMPRKKWKEARARTCTVSIWDSGFPSTTVVRCDIYNRTWMLGACFIDPALQTEGTVRPLTLGVEHEGGVHGVCTSSACVARCKKIFSNVEALPFISSPIIHLQRVARSIFMKMHRKLAMQSAKLGARGSSRCAYVKRSGTGLDGSMHSQGGLHVPKPSPGTGISTHRTSLSRSSNESQPCSLSHVRKLEPACPFVLLSPMKMPTKAIAALAVAVVTEIISRRVCTGICVRP